MPIPAVHTLSLPRSGIPVNDVDSSTAKGGWAQFPARGAISFNLYGDESDPGVACCALCLCTGAGSCPQHQPEALCYLTRAAAGMQACYPLMPAAGLTSSDPPLRPPGPYPFPINAKVEGAWLGCSASACNGDRHVLVRDNNTCELTD